MAKIIKVLRNSSQPIISNPFQRGCPSYARDVASSLLMLGSEKASGVMNLVNSGSASRYEYGLRLPNWLLMMWK